MEQSDTEITRAQKHILLRAILLAEGPGHCQYLDPETRKPKCVVAQAAVLWGEDLQRIEGWAGPVNAVFGIRGLRRTIGPMRIPAVVLDRLQGAWDKDVYAAKGRELMLERLNGFRVRPFEPGDRTHHGHTVSGTDDGAAFDRWYESVNYGLGIAINDTIRKEE